MENKQSPARTPTDKPRADRPRRGNKQAPEPTLAGEAEAHRRDRPRPGKSPDEIKHDAAEAGVNAAIRTRST